MVKSGINYKKEFYKNNHINYFVSIFVMVSIAVLQIGIAFVLQILLDIASSRDMTKLWHSLAIAAIVMVSTIFAYFIKKIFFNRFIKKALSQYKNKVFQKILDKNISAFNKETSSTYISAFSNDLASIEQNYLIGSLNLILQCSLFIGGIMAMAYLNFRMLLGTLATCIIPILVSAIFGNKLTNAEVKVSDENASFVALVKDLLTGFPVIKSFKADREIFHIFVSKNDELEQTKKNRRDIANNIEIFNSFASLIVEITIFGLGVHLSIKGVITVGVVVAFIQLLNYVLGPINSIGPIIANRKAAEGLIEKFQSIAEISNSTDGSTALSSFNNTIVFKNVSFGYTEESSTLTNINLKFIKNKSYAIVGSSGSGKSTLLNLMLGYQNNYKGTIEIDENELRDTSIDSLYDLVSMIQQNVFVFNNSIAENITLFRAFEKEQVDYAIACSGLSKLIGEKGIDYRCGENGVNLSGGEKQRISIARSLIRGTPILMMDEATASLDNETSRLIEDAILKIKNLTKIIVTHKLYADILTQYDQIIVMNKGEIVERGTFNELLEKKGFFYSLYSITNSSEPVNENVI
ncbi:ABC transporter ATP-binding protein [Clostridium folliculivorans]|uniref:ABC transporter ATP-binding protein n=1 Tax=Clostridium folliculivorans TaxID=2886038 RepID=A0A9W5Y068_9CLOT|nr:ABC transporter ATP-binding protein [Clostridium folliculivorans]GKU24175.1 ABC transporter ATP-binding protein [Clostridium folliculivorans]GKU30280.1 ABC transporter ATP-binding protein [Clostridium folliculivorans]